MSLHLLVLLNNYLGLLIKTLIHLQQHLAYPFHFNQMYMESLLLIIPFRLALFQKELTLIHKQGKYLVYLYLEAWDFIHLA